MPAIIRTIWDQQRVLMTFAAAHATLAFACVPLMLIDDRAVLGLDVWVKPQKFALSIAIFLATMAWLLTLHRLPATLSRVFAWVISAGALVEIVLISFQSARGVRSHFNIAQPLDGLIYGIMGVAIVIVTLLVLVVACSPFRASDAGGPSGRALPLGIRLGEWLFLAGCAWGMYMAPKTGHSVGGVDGGPGLPYVNWSTRHGDTRIAHFVLLHALQSMPIVGWAADRFLPGGPARAVTIVAAACIAGVAAFLARTAISGRAPF
jgi:hypothetical protein